MRRLLVILLVLGSLSATFAADGVSGRIVKLLPLLLNTNAQDALSPSLFDRDAYQFYLRQHTNEISGIRFDVLWKASNAAGTKLKLRVELRGIGAGGLPRQTTLEQSVTPGYFRHWAPLTLGGTDYKNFGELVAWRATLWSDDRLLGEQKSFLW